MMAPKEKKEGKEKNEFLEVFGKFLEHSMQAEIRTSKQINRIADSISEQMNRMGDSIEKTNESLGELAQIVSASEQRHSNNQQGMERLGDDTVQNAKDIRKTRDELHTAQSQILLLEQTDAQVEKRFTKADKIVIGVITAVTACTVIFVLGIK